MKKLFLLLTMAFVFMIQSYSFGNFEVCHDLAFMDQVGEVLPVVIIGNDVITFKISKFKYSNLELLINPIYVNMPDNWLHRKNLFLYSLSAQNNQLKNDILNRPLIVYETGFLFHILC